MKESILVRENARVVLQTPTLKGPQPCLFADQLANAGRDLIFGTFKFVDMLQRCPLTIGGVKSHQQVSIEMETVNLRVDYMHPQPVEQGKFEWSSTMALQARANLVDINEEAKGQRLLFAAGITAGLATGVLSIGLERIYRSVQPRFTRSSS
jgi:hypothetical protein